MAGLKRLTHYFYAYKEVENDSFIRYKTNFPFLADDKLLINRPIERSDVVSATGDFDTNLNLEELQNLGESLVISSYGGYNSQKWFLGLSVNKTIIYDGIFKVPSGIIGNFITNNGKQEGVIFIDKTKFTSEFGVLDTIEIIIMSSSPWTPWLYYGYNYGKEKLDQKRKFLMNNIDGGSWRTPTNTGGVPSSMVPAQAIQVRHFVNIDLNALFLPIVIPFPSAFFLGNFGSASSSNNVYNTCDIIDGNGQIALRSSVKFNISSQSLTGTLGPISAAFATVIRADAYRTLNSRKLEYVSSTYSEKKLLKSTIYYICFERNIKYKSIYLSIADSLSVLVDNFVDKTEENKAVFNFITFDSMTVEGLVSNTTDLVSAGNILKEKFSLDDFYTVVPTDDFSKDLGWENENMSTVASFVKSVALSDTGNKYSAAFLSGMNLSENTNGIKILDITTTAISELSKIANVYGVFLKHNSTEFSEEVFSLRKDKGSIIFGNNYLGIQDGTFLGFQVINILYNLIGGRLSSESSLYEESAEEFEVSDSKKITLNGIDSDILKDQSRRLCLESSGVSDRDYDGDGNITLVDRIYGLYGNFNRNNQLIDDRFYGFFGDFGAEMRYWRKVCPYGLNYKLTGRVVSSAARTGGNYILEVIPSWIDDDGNLYEPTETSIYVYIENAVKTNISYGTPDGSILEFQGRLFFPSYIKKLKISPVISLSDPDEFTAWYRISRSTATDLIELSDSIFENEPVIVCRSNLIKVDPAKESVGSFLAPPLFDKDKLGSGQDLLSGNYSQAYYKICQLVEYVSDHVIAVEKRESESVKIDVGTGYSVIFQTTGLIPSNVDGGSNPVSIIFQDISFNVTVDGNTEDFYKYEIEVLYKPSNEENFKQIYKFYSAVCFNESQSESPFLGRIKFNAFDPLRLYCRPYSGEDETLNGRLFDINLSYREIDNFIYSFTFDPEVWAPKIFVNNTFIATKIISNSSEFGTFGSELSQINPFTGQIMFNDKIDLEKASVSVTFDHKNYLKSGSQLAVRVLNGVSVGGVTISDVSINLDSLPSLERVDAAYSSTLYGDYSHLICPTRGFVTLSGDSWFFSQETGTENASNFSPGSLAVVGDLSSPFYYIDAFAEPSDLANKTIKMGNNITDFPIIDIVHTTVAVNGSNAPFTEMQTIDYVPPEPQAQTKIDSVFDSKMRKFSIIYNNNNILNMKYSFTKFEDRDSQESIYDFSNKSLRRNIPIYTGPLSVKEKKIGEDISIDGIFSIEEPNRTAVGLEIYTSKKNSFSFENDNGIFFLQASSGSDFSSFGYVDGSGTKHSLFLSTYNDATTLNGQGYIQIPYSQGLSKLKVIEKENTNTGKIEKINVQYVDNDKFVNGVSGDIELFTTGDYVIFYYSDSGNTFNQIKAVMSSKDGQFWKRPGISDLQSSDSFKPIPVLSNCSHPLVLGNEANDMLFLFVYRNTDNSVNLIHVTRSMFMKLVKGDDDESYSSSGNTGTGDPSITEPENSRSSMMRNEEKKSWKEYFNGSGNHILPITFNSSAIFSATLSERGVIYFVSKSLDNEMRIRINSSEGGTEYNSSGWSDIGVDFFNENGFLQKTLQSFSIYALTLSYDQGMEGLHIFISTTDKLFVYRVPGAILKQKEGPNSSTDDFFQEIANQKKPTLIIGTTNGLSEENTDLSGVALEEPFVPQQVSVNWTEDGMSWLFFVGENKSLRCVTSSSDGKRWKLDLNV